MVAFELECSLVDEVFSGCTMVCLIFFLISWHVLNTAVKPERLGVTLNCFASVEYFLHRNRFRQVSDAPITHLL